MRQLIGPAITAVLLYIIGFTFLIVSHQSLFNQKLSLVFGSIACLMAGIIAGMIFATFLHHLPF